MIDPTAFSAKLAEVKAAMQREEWARAIKAVENIGPIPERFQAVTAGILFFLYVSRNEYAKLARTSANLKPERSKDAVAALLLLRDKALGYPLELPADWTIDKWETAIGTHLGALEPKELRLCLFFLAVLNRPALLEKLHFLALAAGEDLEEEQIVVVVGCFLRHKRFEEARRFVWLNNSKGIGFARFNFLIDRAERGEAAVPESSDKFLRFLHYRFGPTLPVNLSTPTHP